MEADEVEADVILITHGHIDHAAGAERRVVERRVVEQRVPELEDRLGWLALPYASEAVLGDWMGFAAAEREAGVDRIIVLRQGEIVEEGSHAQLMERDGTYRRLVEVQLREDRRGEERGD